MAASIVIVILVLLIFGSSPIVEMILKMRRMKKGDDIIKEPWQEIHDIPGYHDARNIAAFYPLKGEPNIMPILEELAIEGRLLLPKCEGDGIMNFYKISNLKKDLVKGHYGIMEPREGIEKFEGDIPVFLVPGVKFNAGYAVFAGYRDVSVNIDKGSAGIVVGTGVNTDTFRTTV